MESERLRHPRSVFVLFVMSAIYLVFAGFLLAHSKYFYALCAILAGIIFLWLINRAYNKANEAISYFFDSLRNDDTTLNFQEKNTNGSLKKLYESMNILNNHFQKIRLLNEYNETYYKTIIQNASTGLLVLDSKNRIELINKSACNYAGISSESTNRDLLHIKHPKFYEAICNLRPGENITYRNLSSNNLQMLFFRATLIRRNEEDLKLVSIQDIRYELESKELESYRKLISVLTHEIMNLLTPLTTVAKELFSMFNQKDYLEDSAKPDASTIKAAIQGLMLIDEQSNGILNFVNNYRKISKLPQPQFISIDTEEWLSQLRIVFSSKMKENNIAFSIIKDKSIREIIADKNLINQVIINLINNSLEAVVENKSDRRIEISMIRTHDNKTKIRITNNGPLIPPGLQEKIFVPFYTTKKNGSGIGLSISQEIMKLHNGSLVVVSTEEIPTSFIIEF